MSFGGTARGLPWENYPLAQREKEILEAQARDDARDAEQKALEAAGPAAEAAEGEGEPLDLVRSRPLPRLRWARSARKVEQLFVETRIGAPNERV
jgi:hypothetical protein